MKTLVGIGRSSDNEEPVDWETDSWRDGCELKDEGVWVDMMLRGLARGLQLERAKRS